jgi:hypothetical protein
LTAAVDGFENAWVPNEISRASTNRSKCRGCGLTISKGDLRFGESLPNPYREGESLYWFHLACAACMRPEPFLSTLDSSEIELDERTWLRSAAEQGLRYRRLPRLARAERAASGRAQCRLCREPIAKDTFRLALQMFEEGRMQPIGSIHVECAEAHLGTAALGERILRLTPGIEPAELAEIEAALARQRPAPPEVLEALAQAEAANVAGSGSDERAAEAPPGPAIKKVQPPAPPSEAVPAKTGRG